MQRADACSRCGLGHERGELFVTIGDELVVETRELARA
jgi:hypothetical protein